MAERRMFAKTIIDSDAFLDMPSSTQLLYFHLSMRADDDGFINNPKKIQRMAGCGDDDLRLLIAKKYIIWFESGVIVIKHWKMHNYIQSDRYKPTVYTAERKMLSVKPNKSYTLVAPTSEPLEIEQCIQDGYKMDTQVRLGKVRLGKVSKDISHKYGEYKNVLLSDIDYKRLLEEFPLDYQQRIERLSEYMASTGKSYKSHLATIRAWSRKDADKSKPKRDVLMEIISEGRNEQGRNSPNNETDPVAVPRLLP